MVLKWKKILIPEEGDEVYWKRDGYSYTGNVVEVVYGDDEQNSYYVEYQLDPRTKSWTTVNYDELDILKLKLRHNPPM